VCHSDVSNLRDLMEVTPCFPWDVDDINRDLQGDDINKDYDDCTYNYSYLPYLHRTPHHHHHTFKFIDGLMQS